MTVQSLISNWKTTSAGLTLIIGSTVHLIFAVKGHTADENTWTVSLTAIFGGLGLIFAGDASNVKNIAASVDKINATGSDPGSVPANQKQPEKKVDEV